MKRTIVALGALGAIIFGDAFAVTRGNQVNANAYKQNQKNTYFLVTQPDVDTACRERIYKCLSNYCGDTTIIPGQNNSRCQYATESELYNYALLCLQKDTSILLPQYNVNYHNGTGGTNTAARLCPPYVQQELMSYLSMANMATQLQKSHSDLCLQRRQELEAAISCHAIAMEYGNSTSSQLINQLTEYCGSGVPGGSTEMVTRFSNAGNIGANIWDWANKIVSADMNKKGTDWQNAMDSVLATYANRMNLACGDDYKINTATHNTTIPNTNTLQNAIIGTSNTAFPSAITTPNQTGTQSLYMEITTMSEMWDYNTAYQVVNAAMSNPATTQNAFLTSSQMDNMQNAYKLGTKVFIMRDSARCYVIPVNSLTATETSLIAQTFASCISK